MNPLRTPPVETADLYPGLVVQDNRVTGSITVGPTRLPIWAVIADLVNGGWDDVEHGYGPFLDRFDADDFAEFVFSLLNLRGEFARLLLALANVERLEGENESSERWWENRHMRRPVADLLRRCLDVVEGPAETFTMDDWVTRRSETADFLRQIDDWENQHIVEFTVNADRKVISYRRYVTCGDFIVFADGEPVSETVRL